MNQTPNETASHESKADLGRMLPVAAVLIVVVLGGYAYMSSQSQRRLAEEQLEQQENDNVKLQQQMANLESTLAELKTAKVYKQEDIAVAKANAMGIMSKGEKISAKIDELSKAMSALEEKRLALESNEMGRKIASDSALVQQVIAALDTTLPQAGLASSLQTRLEQLLIAPQAALDQGIAGYVPGQQLIDALDAVSVETSRAEQTAVRVLGDLNAISMQASALPPHPDLNLSQAIETINQRLDDERRAMVAGTIEQAKREAAELLAEQEAENQKKIAEAERQAKELLGDEMAAKILSDAKQKEVELARELQEREAAQAKAKLEAEFAKDEAEIRRLLPALLQDGNSYLADSVRTKGPVSYSKLVEKGVFRDSWKGIWSLCLIAHDRNDRSPGPLPFNDGRGDWWETVDREIPSRAHELLVKYAELMVEKGMLNE